MARELLSGIGLVTHFGPRGVNDGLPGGVSTYGAKTQLTLPFTFDELNEGPDLPVIDADDDSTQLLIPANSVITDAWLHVVVAFAGGTNLAIGLQQADGTVIDADGLFTTTAAAQANLTAGAWIKGDGALVATGGAGTDEAIGANNAQLAIDETGAFTAGSAVLFVEYMQPYLANN